MKHTSTRRAIVQGMRLLEVLLPGLMLCPAALSASTPAIDFPLFQGAVEVEIYENLDKENPLDLSHAELTARYREPAFGFVEIPPKYSYNALPLDRSTPFALRATFKSKQLQGEYRFRLRSKGLARFSVSGQALLTTLAQDSNDTSHDKLPPVLMPDPKLPFLRQSPAPHQEVKAVANLDKTETAFELIAIIGGKGLVPFPGDLSVSLGEIDQMPRLLGSPYAPLLTEEGWDAYETNRLSAHHSAAIRYRRNVSAQVAAAWDAYHEKVRQWVATLSPITPPEVSTETPVFNDVDRFIGKRLEAAGQRPNELISDLEFFRRVCLDIIGVGPLPEDIQGYLADPPETRRTLAIDRLLDNPGWADHWVSYWQDVLAENPGILKPDLNNSGPFRWWLHQSFFDDIPFDRLVAELTQMQGSVYLGGPAGFSIAKMNDAPMAAKSDVLAQAFLGEKLSCARCHDAPNHPHKQLDTFSLAAMLKGDSLKLPVTSTVPFIEGFRKPRVQVSLDPGQLIDPHWPFEQLSEASNIDAQMPLDEDVPASRNEVARLIASPQNERFSQVVANRVWKRYMGAGLVEPAEDWQFYVASHPDLLEYLGREFVRSGFDLKALARLIFTSHAYQRRPVTTLLAKAEPEDRLFVGPARRRLTAEQLVDSLHRAVGKGFHCEELNLNPLGDRPLSQFLNMGHPERSWEFTAMMNERDRPSLALPGAQAIVDVLSTYGWRQSRMNPITDRNSPASPMQTLLLANGVMGTRMVRLSDASIFTELGLQDMSLNDLIEETFLRILSRPPYLHEQKLAGEFLQPVYADRRIAGATRKAATKYQSDVRVSWANHFDDDSNRIRMEEERSLRRGEEPTKVFTTEYRERFEDFLWSLINSPEFIVIP